MYQRGEYFSYEGCSRQLGLFGQHQKDILCLLPARDLSE